MIPKNLGSIDSGKIRFESKRFGLVDLLHLSNEQMNQIRGNEISLMMQETHAALNPSRRVGHIIEQMMEKEARVISKKETTLSLLRELNFPEPEKVYDSLPSELSGGMAQRVNLAIAITGNPQILIADECTSSLDEENASIIMDLLLNEVKQKSLSLIFISHDLGLMRSITGNIMKMENGKLLPAMVENPNQEPIPVMTQKPLNDDPWLEIKDLRIDFHASSDLWKWKKKKKTVLKDFSIEIKKGQSLGIYGESGSGKSTLAKLILGLIEPDQGSIRVNGKNPFSQTLKEKKAFYLENQLVQQELTLSLNPLKTVLFHLREPLRIHGISDKRDEKVKELVNKVNLGTDILKRYPHQLSVGQRQRVLMARAMILEPKVLVLDEAVSSLDQENKREILEILKKHKEEKQTHLIFIAHEKEILEDICERIIELKEGAWKEKTAPQEKIE